MSSRRDRSQPHSPARHGIWLIPIAAITAAVIFTYWLTAPSADSDLAGLAEWNTSVAGYTSGILYLLSLIALILGLSALYGLLANSRQRNWALTGLICGVISLGFITAAMGAAVLAGAVVADIYLSGNDAAGAVLEDMSGGSFGTGVLIAFILGMGVGVISAVATGYAIWKTEWVPKWSAVLIGLGFVLFITTAPVTTHVGALLLAGGVAWIGRTLASSSVTTTDRDVSPALAS